MRTNLLILLTLTVVLGAVVGAASPSPVATPAWPGLVDLFPGTSGYTQTVQSRSFDAGGARYLHLLYDTGRPTITGTFTITASQTWNGNVFSTQVITASINPSVAATGVITITDGVPVYPGGLVQLEFTPVTTETGAYTPTVAAYGL